MEDHAWYVVADTVETIQARLDEDWSVERLAERSGYSRFHFSRLFAQVCQSTPAAYVRALRLERAAEQLIYAPERPIAQLAREAGYGSIEAFSRAFHHHLGQPPSAWREHRRLNHLQAPRPLEAPLRVDDGLFPEGLAAQPEILVTAPLRAWSLRCASFDLEGWTQAMAVLLAQHERAPEPYSIGALAQPWGWVDGPRKEPELRVLRFIETHEPPPTPCLRWALGPHHYARFDYEGPYARLDVVTHWIMSEWIPRAGLRSAFLPTFNRLAEAHAPQGHVQIYAPVASLA